MCELTEGTCRDHVLWWTCHAITYGRSLRSLLLLQHCSTPAVHTILLCRYSCAHCTVQSGAGRSGNPGTTAHLSVLTECCFYPIFTVSTFCLVLRTRASRVTHGLRWQFRGFINVRKPSENLLRAVNDDVTHGRGASLPPGTDARD